MLGVRIRGKATATVIGRVVGLLLLSLSRRLHVLEVHPVGLSALLEMSDAFVEEEAARPARRRALEHTLDGVAVFRKDQAGVSLLFAKRAVPGVHCILHCG